MIRFVLQSERLGPLPLVNHFIQRVGKPTVRNFRGEDGNGSYRAILLPERKAETPKRPSLSLRLRAPYLYPDQRRDLLVAMGPDRRHPVKAVASRVSASRLAALTGCRRPGRGLASR